VSPTPGPGVDPGEQYVERAIIREHRSPGETKRCHEEPTAFVTHRPRPVDHGPHVHAIQTRSAVDRRIEVAAALVLLIREGVEGVEQRHAGESYATRRCCVTSPIADIRPARRICAPQRERPPELDPDHGPRLRAPARAQHHAQDTMDTEPRARHSERRSCDCMFSVCPRFANMVAATPLRSLPSALEETSMRWTRACLICSYF